MAKTKNKKAILSKLSAKPTIVAKKTVKVVKNKVTIGTKVVNLVDKAVSSIKDMTTLNSFKSPGLSGDELPPPKLVQRITLPTKREKAETISYADFSRYRVPLYRKRTTLIPSNRTYYWFQITYCSNYSPPTTEHNYLGFYGLSYTRETSPFECFARYTFNKGVKLIAMRTRKTSTTPNVYTWTYEVGINPLVLDEAPLISNISDIGDYGYVEEGQRHHWVFLIADDNPYFSYFSSLGLLHAIDTKLSSIITNSAVDSEGKQCDIGWVNETLRIKEYI